jgi:branched-chain amino acid transport system ATP-binding protein
MAEAILVAQGLHTYYGASHILRGIDFTIHAGDSIGLMGRNGMGKTTLIRTLLGWVRPRSGSITLRGRDAGTLKPHQIAHAGIAYVPEGRGIFPNLSVRENLLMAAGSGPAGRAEWTYDRVLSTFPRLGERLSNGGAQLSGGEQQMLTIARALLTNPDVLILDEATEGLAPLIAREIWRTIGEIKASGIATIVVDKNYRHLLAVADRAVILVKGEVALADTATRIAAQSGALSSLLGV